MIKRRRNNWLDLSFGAFSAGLEAQQVVVLRLAKIARGGPQASEESHRMVAEKTSAAIQVHQAATLSLMRGAAATIPGRTLSTYRRKMQANRRRLLRELG